MSPSLKLGIYIFMGVVAAWFAIHLLKMVLGWVLSLVVPVAVIAVIGYAVYSLFGRKALGGSRRILP